MTANKTNALIVEGDLVLGNGVYAAADSRLTPGEYEVHIVPDNSRTIIKRFIVDKTAAAPMALRFDIEFIEDAAERKKTEVVRIGPSLAELEAQVAGLVTQVAELKKKVSP
jgi:hypothetical protein